MRIAKSINSQSKLYLYSEIDKSSGSNKSKKNDSGLPNFPKIDPHKEVIGPDGKRIVVHKPPIGVDFLLMPFEVSIHSVGDGQLPGNQSLKEGGEQDSLPPSED